METQLLTLMLIGLASAQLALELGADLVEELIETSSAIARGHTPHASMGGIHGHCFELADCLIETDAEAGVDDLNVVEPRWR